VCRTASSRIQKSFSASTWRRLTKNYPHHSPLLARTSHPPLLHSMWRNPRKVLSRARAIFRLRWEGETTQYANPSLDELAVVYLYARARIGQSRASQFVHLTDIRGKFPHDRAYGWPARHNHVRALAITKTRHPCPFPLHSFNLPPMYIFW
jgi:hypothetical protein